MDQIALKHSTNRFSFIKENTLKTILENLNRLSLSENREISNNNLEYFKTVFQTIQDNKRR
jgi:hypothetical protein